MHKASSTEPTEDEIRGSRELAIVKPKPQSTRVQGAAQNKLGFRVFSANLRHDARADRRINDVNHGVECDSRQTGNGPLEPGGRRPLVSSAEFASCAKTCDNFGVCHGGSANLQVSYWKLRE